MTTRPASAPENRYARLREVLGGDGLSRLRQRLRGRLERGAAVTGRLVLPEATQEERGAIERLFGRVTRGSAIHVDLDELASLLRAAELSSDLATALREIEGPIADRRAERSAREAAWAAVFSEARTVTDPRWSTWLEELEASGLLRRLAAGDPARGNALLAKARAVLGRLPAPAQPLAELAASATGDSHALDTGAALATLVQRALALAAGVPPPSDPDERRSLWAGVGVLVDELSAPVLVLDLPALVRGGTGRALELARQLGEPARVSTRQLLRDPPAVATELIPDRLVFVCENPSVVAAAADRLAGRCRPLICTEGQPKTALRLLLDHLRRAGLRLAYHCDFDWPGIHIGNLLTTRFHAEPWCFGSADYLAAPDGAPLEGGPVEPVWDAELGEAMRRRGRAVHEEAIVDRLISGLSL